MFSRMILRCGGVAARAGLQFPSASQVQAEQASGSILRRKGPRRWPLLEGQLPVCSSDSLRVRVMTALLFLCWHVFGVNEGQRHRGINIGYQLVAAKAGMRDMTSLSWRMPSESR